MNRRSSWIGGSLLAALIVRASGRSGGGRQGGRGGGGTLGRRTCPCAAGLRGSTGVQGCPCFKPPKMPHAAAPSRGNAAQGHGRTNNAMTRTNNANAQTRTNNAMTRANNAQTRANNAQPGDNDGCDGHDGHAGTGQPPRRTTPHRHPIHHHFSVRLHLRHRRERPQLPGLWLRSGLPEPLLRPELWLRQIPE